jgi:ABC-type molybdate transport system ATPase subunit
MKNELSIPILHVTHDIREALFLADEILPVVRGRVCHKWLLQFMLSAREGFPARTQPQVAIQNCTRTSTFRKDQGVYEMNIGTYSIDDYMHLVKSFHGNLAPGSS